ncbi:MAG: hypothetical protein OXL33_02330 [Chloroflexota bacterium]|nr:hypothetical protein [Chloroflexota bacterium]
MRKPIKETFTSRIAGLTQERRESVNLVDRDQGVFVAAAVDRVSKPAGAEPESRHVYSSEIGGSIA